MSEHLPDRPWTIEELADYLQISRSTIEARIRDDGLPVRWVGGLRRFLRAEVDAWLRERPARAS
jgi:excisionase family DNA binding protein